MQDRYRRIDEILLRRTAGPYIGSFSTDPAGFVCRLMSASPQKRPKCCVAAK
jgi:hypothetical protein